MQASQLPGDQHRQRTTDQTLREGALSACWVSGAWRRRGRRRPARRVTGGRAV